MVLKGRVPGACSSPVLLSSVCCAISAATVWETEKTLRNGRSMPTLGLQIPVEEPQGSIAWSTSFGYRMLDIVGNESIAGQAIRQSSTPRSHLFLSTRLFEHGFQEAHRAIRQTLQKLRMDFVDLYMMASPAPGKIMETWDAMIEMRKMGLVRSLGVCEFELVHLQSLKSHGRVLPDVLQLGINPLNWHRHKKVIDWSKQEGILVQSASPFHSGEALQSKILQSFPALQDFRAKSVAQVLLRWAIQMDFQVIPKSRRKDHIAENRGVWSFNLTDREMQLISSLGEESPMLADGQRKTEYTIIDVGETGLGNRSRELLDPVAAEL